jgi:hypothetical protein
LKRKTILTKEKKNKRRRIKLLKIIYHKFGFKNENEKKKFLIKPRKN